MKDDLRTSGRGGVFDNTATPSRPTVSVNVERYQAFLDGSDMTEAQKEEFLQALWSIIVSFVELGFGVHPLQEVCGKPPEVGADGAQKDFDAVSSEQPGEDGSNNGFKP
ncbi:hypothetical protein ACFQXB_01555 [Plastorhodobacter daqingensis]|uniref:Uncharacterized protein n=1 Tax=Plastorhodobacter daqingensis TaxID=1387281 RepID=A0ABW2UDY4_9RHOB